MSFRRMAGVSGIASVVLFVASFIAYGSTPSTDATAEEVARYVADSGGFASANAFGALAALAMLVFLVGFAIPFWRSDRDHDEAFGTVIVASGAVAVAAIAIASGLFGALSNRVASLDGPSVWVLWDGGNSMFAVAVLTFFLGAGAAASAVMRHGVMPLWFGWLSGVVAVLALTGLIPFFTSSGAALLIVVGYLGFLVWELAASILMVRTEG